MAGRDVPYAINNKPVGSAGMKHEVEAWLQARSGDERRPLQLASDITRGSNACGRQSLKTRARAPRGGSGVELKTRFMWRTDISSGKGFFVK